MYSGIDLHSNNSVVTVFRSAKNGRDQAATQQHKTCGGQNEESFGIAIAIMTHEPPVASAPGDGANQLIKIFGIPGVRGRAVLERPPSPQNPLAAIGRAARCR